MFWTYSRNSSTLVEYSLLDEDESVGVGVGVISSFCDTEVLALATLLRREDRRVTKGGDGTVPVEAVSFWIVM